MVNGRPHALVVEENPQYLLSLQEVSGGEVVIEGERDPIMAMGRLGIEKFDVVFVDEQVAEKALVREFVRVLDKWRLPTFLLTSKEVVQRVWPEARTIEKSRRDWIVQKAIMVAQSAK